ncbi:MAG: M20/M25/M40 family metallo-hydrolase [Candidatus Heimdallarchaeota archaeon]|nr:M20/M25/M40 family metallo-hydrolase [Candidatus Heimdallarchaeota archaeon]
MSDNVLDETFSLLTELIQNKCVNPPGNEMKSIKSIEKFLKKKGISCKTFESAPNRGNLVAKIEGLEKNHPGLIFGPSHVDVVPVTKLEDWDVDPFAGDIKDGYIWGRGALDMLFIVVSQVQAFAKLHKENFEPKGDLVLFIVADEECGGKYGAKWMMDNHFEELGFKNKKMYAVTESGGITIAPGKLKFINGEKGVFLKRLIFKGTPGHGSMPYASNNAILKASKAVTLLSKYCDNKIPVNTQYLSDLVKGMDMNFLARFMITNKRILPFTLKILKKREPEMAKLLHALSRMTISPNIVKGGTKTNIIATDAQLVLDIRTLPGQDEHYVISHIKKAIGSLAEEVEIVGVEEEEFMLIGSVSPANSDFVIMMEKAIQKEMPNAKLVPLVAMGRTDGRFLREQNVDTYGFSLFDPDAPMHEYIELIHGINERISIKTVELSLKVYYNLAKEFLT